jgi:hypothetical protein
MPIFTRSHQESSLKTDVARSSRIRFEQLRAREQAEAEYNRQVAQEKAQFEESKARLGELEQQRQFLFGQEQSKIPEWTSKETELMLKQNTELVRRDYTIRAMAGVNDPTFWLQEHAKWETFDKSIQESFRSMSQEKESLKQQEEAINKQIAGIVGKYGGEEGLGQFKESEIARQSYLANLQSIEQSRSDIALRNWAVSMIKQPTAEQRKEPVPITLTGKESLKIDYKGFMAGYRYEGGQYVPEKQTLSTGFITNQDMQLIRNQMSVVTTPSGMISTAFPERYIGGYVNVNQPSLNLITSQKQGFSSIGYTPQQVSDIEKIRLEKGQLVADVTSLTPAGIFRTGVEAFIINPLLTGKIMPGEQYRMQKGWQVSEELYSAKTTQQKIDLTLRKMGEEALGETMIFSPRIIAEPLFIGMSAYQTGRTIAEPTKENIVNLATIPILFGLSKAIGVFREPTARPSDISVSGYDAKVLTGEKMPVSLAELDVFTKAGKQTIKSKITGGITSGEIGEGLSTSTGRFKEKFTTILERKDLSKITGDRVFQERIGRSDILTENKIGMVTPPEAEFSKFASMTDIAALIDKNLLSQAKSIAVTEKVMTLEGQGLQSFFKRNVQFEKISTYFSEGHGIRLKDMLKRPGLEKISRTMGITVENMGKTKVFQDIRPEPNVNIAKGRIEIFEIPSKEILERKPLWFEKDVKIVGSKSVVDTTIDASGNQIQQVVNKVMSERTTWPTELKKGGITSAVKSAAEGTASEFKLIAMHEPSTRLGLALPTASMSRAMEQQDQAVRQINKQMHKQQLKLKQEPGLDFSRAFGDTGLRTQTKEKMALATGMEIMTIQMQEQTQEQTQQQIEDIMERFAPVQPIPIEIPKEKQPTIPPFTFPGLDTRRSFINKRKQYKFRTKYSEKIHNIATPRQMLENMLGFPKRTKRRRRKR